MAVIWLKWYPQSLWPSNSAGFKSILAKQEIANETVVDVNID